jgi:hypothetical protein
MKSLLRSINNDQNFQRMRLLVANNHTKNATLVESAYAKKMETIFGFGLLIIIAGATGVCLYQLLKYRGDPNKLSLWKEWFYSTTELQEDTDEMIPKHRQVAIRQTIYAA